MIEADGTRHVLSPMLADALARVARALANGQAITIAPTQLLLTTQEAAELLGVSRPTLVKLLERDEVPFTLHGRHRRIMLSDLLAYRESLATRRRESLARMQRTSEEDGLYDLLDEAPGETR